LKKGQNCISHKTVSVGISELHEQDGADLDKSVCLSVCDVGGS